MKGGSIASKHVLGLLPKKCNNVLKQHKLPMGNKNITGRFYQVASGRRKRKYQQ